MSAPRPDIIPAAVQAAVAMSAATPDGGDPAADRPPSYVSRSCAASFSGAWHGGTPGEGAFSTTSARRGALRRGASPGTMNGIEWTGWVDVARHEPNPLPFDPSVSPIRPAVLAAGLASHPNRPFVNQVIQMTTSGVSLGADAYIVDGPRVQNNLKSASMYPTLVRAWIQTEIDAGRVAGPFAEPPHPSMQCWGVGVIPKNGSDLRVPGAKARVIVHLSQEDDGFPSLNAGMSSEDATLVYSRVVDSVDTIVAYTAAGGDPHFALADLKHAYRNICVRGADLTLTGFRFPNADTGTVEWYYDRCLSFGGRSAPSRFDTLACAIQYIAEERCAAEGLQICFKHYLDDTICIGMDAAQTTRGFTILLELFEELGIPAQEDKTTPTTKADVFLGIYVDIANSRLAIPRDKRDKWSAELRHIQGGGTYTPRSLASLAGKLTFGGVAFPALRPQVGILYKLSAPALRDGHGGAVRHPSPELRSTAKLFADCLDSDPTCPFSAFNAEPATANVFYSVDAAGMVGLGGFSLPNGPGGGPASAYFAEWPPGFTQGSPGVSSGLQETLTVAALVDQHEGDNQHLHFWSDSSVAVDAIARGRSDSPALNRTLAFLLSVCATRSLTVTVSWHRRGNNPTALCADALSRGLWVQAEELFPPIAGASRRRIYTETCRAFATPPSSTTTSL